VDSCWIDRSRLWLVLDRDSARPHSLAEATQLAIEGGADAVVFRMKDADAGEASGHAKRVRQVCSRAGIPFVLAHFLELVEELQPDAFHAGLADGPLPAIRYKLPHEVALGYSAHSIAEAAQAIEDGADYLFLGPIFATPSKEQYGDPLGLDMVRQASGLNKPVVFIGGMNAANLQDAVAAGATRAAVISAVLSTDTPSLAAAQLRALLP
jgi:thiamine-phosphate pyrophosphorylase